MINKNHLRDKFLKIRGSMSKNLVSELSEQIVDNFLSMKCYHDFKDIFIYVSYKNEVRTHSLIKKLINDNKNVYVPLTNKKTKEMQAIMIKDFNQDLVEGNYGILEPRNDGKSIKPAKLDLVVVPGLLFSKTGYRIGYGGGFYDRFLDKVDFNGSGPIKLGFSYSRFLISSVPINKYDIPVDYIITEKNTIDCSQYRS
ncbi:MAG: 5-formyltetrahydrofolate cyclo-ligase [Bacillota bacterium]